MQSSIINSTLSVTSAVNIIRTITNEKIRALENSIAENSYEEEAEICERQIKQLQHQQATLVQEMIQNPQKKVFIETKFLV